MSDWAQTAVRFLLGFRRVSLMISKAMHSPLFTSAYAFALVFLFLLGVCLVARFCLRVLGFGRARQDRRPEPQWQVKAANRRDSSARRRPDFVPPPTPQTEQEYWQAEQYHREHGMPAPLPPLQREREDW